VVILTVGGPEGNPAGRRRGRGSRHAQAAQGSTSPSWSTRSPGP